MVKYIIKRILLSILILLGVSLIIYILVRLMPADYLETKYSQQLAQNTITQEQVDQFKKDAGLYMPDGFLTVTVDDESYECNGESFVRDIKSVNYERMIAGNMAASELYQGNYYTDDGRWQLKLNKDGNYTLYRLATGQNQVLDGTYSVVSVTELTLNGLDGKVSYNKDADSESGYILFTVNGGSYNGRILRHEVSDSDYRRAQSGDYSLEELFRGEWETGDGTLRLTLNNDGKFALYEMRGSATTVASGTYEVDDEGITDQEGNITHELTLFGLQIKPIEYRQATLGEKAGAVLGGYFSWLGNMLQGNFGRSFTYLKPVTEVIADHMWISFIISFIALVLEFVIAIPLGITSATHQYSARDYFVTVVTMIGISFPSFFFAALLIKLFSSTLGWFPTMGLVSGGSSATGIVRLGDMAWHLVLPMLTMVVLSIGGTMRYTRTNMLEVLNSDYIRTARAKGLSEKRVVYVHAFRNTLIPLMTILAGILPSLFGGAMITEEVFAIDGIGRIAYKSLTQGDLPLIMGYNMFLAILTVIGTLLSDIMYAVVDPRVKLTK